LAALTSEFDGIIRISVNRFEYCWCLPPRAPNYYEVSTRRFQRKEEGGNANKLGFGWRQRSLDVRDEFLAKLVGIRQGWRICAVNSAGRSR